MSDYMCAKGCGVALSNQDSVELYTAKGILQKAAHKKCPVLTDADLLELEEDLAGSRGMDSRWQRLIAEIRMSRIQIKDLDAKYTASLYDKR